MARWIWIIIWRWWIFTSTRTTRRTKSLKRYWPALKRLLQRCRSFPRHGRRFRGCIPTIGFTYTRKLIQRKIVPRLWLLRKKGFIPTPKMLWHISIWRSPSSMMVTATDFAKPREPRYASIPMMPRCWPIWVAISFSSTTRTKVKTWWKRPWSLVPGTLLGTIFRSRCTITPVKRRAMR